MSHANQMCNEITMDIDNRAAGKSMAKDQGPEMRRDAGPLSKGHNGQVDGHSFRKALGRFPTGVTVVTSRNANGRNVGATISAFASVSLDPPLVLFCITHDSETLAAIQETGRCVINVLAEDQEPISTLFSAPKVDWSQAVLRDSENDYPQIEGCLAYLGATLHAVHTGGDHTIVVLLITDVIATDGRPLVHHRSAYSRLVDVGPQGEET